MREPWSHRAYELPEPSGRADAWPPRTIEEAMDHARRNRAEQPGLAIDDATLRRVAEYVTSPDHAAHGLF